MPIFKPRTVVVASAVADALLAAGDPGVLGKSGSNTAPTSVGVAMPDQVLAWDLYDRVGPVAYAHRYSANVMRRVRFYAAVRDPEGGDPIPGDRAAVTQPDGSPAVVTPQEWSDAQGCVEQVADPLEGQGGISYYLELNLKVAGDLYVTCEPQPDGREEWRVRSVVAISKKPIGQVGRAQAGAGWWVPDEITGRGFRELAAESSVLRIYQPHPKDPRRSDCAMLHVLTDCEEYDYLSRGVISSARSIVAGNGLFLFPNELEIPPDPDSPEEMAERRGSAGTLLRMIGRAMSAGIKDPTSPQATAPIAIGGPGEKLQYARHLTFVRPIDEFHMKTRGEKLKVISIGLELPQERLSIDGLANNNHWSAAQVSQDEWNSHLDPDARVIAANWTTQILRPMLADLGYDPQACDRWVVWYDPTEAIKQPDMSVNAQKAHDRYAISDRSLRVASGFDEDDAPTPEEISARVERKRLEHTRSQDGPEQIPTPDIAPEGGDGPERTDDGGSQHAKNSATVRASAAGLDRLAWLARHDPAKLRRLEAAGARSALLAAGNGRRRDLGQQLSALNERLLQRVLTAADAAMRRELERAGARIQQAAARRGVVAGGNRRAATEQLRGVPKRRIAQHLGRPAVDALIAAGDLALTDDDAFEDFCDQVDGWTDDTRDRAKDLIVAAAIALALSRGKDDSGITGPVLSEWRARQQQDSTTGRTALKAAMLDTLARRLYDPDPRVDERGEYDPDMTVSAGVIRDPLAAYGGATNGTTGDSSLIGAPFGALLVADGVTQLGLARSGGLFAVGYGWRHGSPLHPFEPHEQLDGTEFSSFDDSALAVDDTYAWIESATGGYYPGDHDGCTCILEVTFGSGDDLG